MITKHVLLFYPNLNKHVDIHTDVSDTQLGSVLRHNVKPIGFYSNRLTKP